MADHAIDLSEAITLYLTHYPGKNDAEFDTQYGNELAPATRENVHAILQEAMKVEPDWSRLTLNEAGDFVESVIHDRHPDLSKEALAAIGNYYTYLMR